MTITIKCKGLVCDTEIEIPTPEGFVDDGDCEMYCKKCSQEKEFLDSVCPGCVSGFPDCGLGESFKFSKFKITNDDLNTIKGGLCPFRVNGTFIGSPGTGIKRVNISDKSENGEVMVEKIIEYHQKYLKYYE